METDVASGSRMLITVCTYKERENLERLIPRLREVAPAADVVIVDDSSPDGTAEFVRQLGAADPKVLLLLRAEKQGLGAATLHGFRWGVERGYDWVLNLDADFSHPPEAIPRLIAESGRFDVVIGSRYVPGGGVVGWPASRRWMSWGANLLARTLLGLKARDCSGAYRLYRVALLKQLDFDGIRSLGYAFQEEFLYRCAAAGGRIGEVPIVFEDRIVGTSKVNTREIRRAIGDLFALGWERCLGRTPRATSAMSAAAKNEAAGSAAGG